MIHLLLCDLQSILKLQLQKTHAGTYIVGTDMITIVVILKFDVMWVGWYILMTLGVITD